MGEGKIICIDGPSNSGKTTLCKKIAENKNFVYIRECTEGIECPKPSKTREEEIYNQLFYFDIEKKRMEEAIKISSEGKNVVMDRSPLSIVAIAYAFEKLGKYETFEDAKKQYIEFMRNTKKPDTFIFLTADQDDINKRNEFKNLSKDWISKEFTDLQLKFNERMSRTLPNSQS